MQKGRAWPFHYVQMGRSWPYHYVQKGRARLFHCMQKSRAWPGHCLRKDRSGRFYSIQTKPRVALPLCTKGLCVAVPLLTKGPCVALPPRTRAAHGPPIPSVGCVRGDRHLAGSSRSFTAIRKDAGLCCGSRLRKGEVFAYVGLPQNLKDLKVGRALPLYVAVRPRMVLLSVVVQPRTALRIQW